MRHTRHIDRRALFASGAAAALLAASGLSAGPAPRQGGRLRMALSGAARSDSFGSRILGGYGPRAPMGLFMQVGMAGVIFDTLTEIAADGTLRGELATGWQCTADATVWDVDLRKEVRFHDGALFTAEDVVVSFDPLCNDGNFLRNVSRAVPLGPHRIRFELFARDPDFPFLLSDPRLVISGKDRLAEGVGTGLYRLHKFEPGRQLVAHRVERHYKDGNAGWFDSVELVGLSSDAVRAEALRDGYVDVADLTATEDLGVLDAITLLPERDTMNSAAHRRVALPTQIGTRWPLDNLRAAERWWMA